MVLYIIALVFLIFMFSMLLCCLACMSCLGLTDVAKNFITRYNRGSYDRQFVANQNNGPINTQCFICLQSIKCEVVATCNHSFCANCIVPYIQSKPNTAIDCPACRKQVLVLFRKFEPSNQQQRMLKQKICEYNYAYSQQPSLFRSIFEIGSLIRQAPRLLTPEGIRYMLSNPRVKIILIMIIYTLSPLDILPQALLGPIGLIDDSFVMMNIVRQFSGMLVNFVGEQAVREGQRQRRQD